LLHIGAVCLACTQPNDRVRSSPFDRLERHFEIPILIPI
jgi:hypothetical protein